MGKKIKILLQGLRNIIQGHWKNGAWCNFFFWRRKVLSGYTKYSVVTPAYNVELYLDDYFNSLVSQKLDFVNNIQLILVDYGSTDGTAKKIAQWQEKFPNNIIYVFQQNQEVNVARNTGLAYACHSWVTFIDADDFIHPNYFWHVDCLLSSYAGDKIKLLSCKEIVYYEDQNKFRDHRPFRIFHQHRGVLQPHNNLQDYLQFSVSSAFFSLHEIKRQGIYFKADNDWRSFEDAHFVLRFLKGTQDGHILFSCAPLYYYRKRANSSSSIDTGRFRKQYFIDVLRDGYLDILNSYKSDLGTVPAFVQRSILYDISWRLKDIESGISRISLLSMSEQQFFLELCDIVFSYIDSKIILDFPEELSGFGLLYKLGVLHCFKRENFFSDIAWCDKVDIEHELVRAYYYTSTPDVQEYLYDEENKPVEVVYRKVVHKNFLERTFLYEVCLWIKLPLINQRIGISVGGKDMDWSIGSQRLKTISLHDVNQTFCLSAEAHDGSWILLDRLDQADDNAEHLYRYIASCHPEQKIYFALRKTSPDWHRLKGEGFNLLPYETRRYYRQLAKASKVISSHLDIDRQKIVKNKKFVFLQHGVILSNISKWVNNRNIDCFVTATPQEYESIVSDCSPYIYGQKEVVCTGAPRHDVLLALGSSIEVKREILIMPTWRRELAELLAKTKSDEERGSLLRKSSYAQAWLDFLQSAELSQLLKEYRYKIFFSPHCEMQRLFYTVAWPDYVLFAPNYHGSIQRKIAEAAIMVTDYSSVACDLALLQRPVIYYQFDVSSFFFGAHIYQKGYFEYQTNGFGPVTTSQEELLQALYLLLARGAQPEPQYRERMIRDLPFRDGKNCERVYEAITKK